MDKPNATQAIRDPQHVADLIDSTGLSERELATRLGVHVRSIRRYRARGSPYPVQFCLEILARK